MIRLVIFDLDGVLLHGRYFTDRLGEKYGIPRQEIVDVLKNEIVTAKNKDISTFSIWQPHLEKWHVSMNEAEFFEFWFSGDLPVPENIALVERLSNQVDMVVLMSDNFSERVDYLRKNMRFLYLFDEVYFSNEIGHAKSDPAAFEYVLNDQGVSADETLLVDNSETAIQKAASLGIHTHLYQDRTKLLVDLRQYGIYLSEMI